MHTINICVLFIVCSSRPKVFFALVLKSFFAFCNCHIFSLSQSRQVHFWTKTLLIAHILPFSLLKSLLKSMLTFCIKDA
ncbi:TPA: hypothetical protein DEG21_00665 [Patescibacteria group bacterium]|nr:hypothetical protein [Candidatus Gracilibacteria bacterium]